MRFPNLQLQTVYNQALQNAYIHFPEDEYRNEDVTDVRETTYMGLTHLYNRLVSPNQGPIRFLTTYSLERDTDTMYYVQLQPEQPQQQQQQQQQEQEQEQPQEEEITQEEEDDGTEVISVASSQTCGE